MRSLARRNRRRNRNMIVASALTIAGTWLLQTRASDAAQSQQTPPHGQSPERPRPAAPDGGDGDGYIAAPPGS